MKLSNKSKRDIFVTFWVTLIAITITMRFEGEGILGFKKEDTIVVEAANSGEQDRPSITVTPTVTPLSPASEPVGAPKTVEGIIRETFEDDAERALKVAKCESGLNPTAKSKHSTATGVFQIIKGTWALYQCEGERTNAADNIACAKKIYDRNERKFNTGGGWAASYACHGQD